MRKTIKTQCYIMSKNVFKNKTGCRMWLKGRKIKIPRCCKIYVMDKEFIIKLRDRSKFNNTKKKYVRKGVKCIEGYLK